MKEYIDNIEEQDYIFDQLDSMQERWCPSKPLNVELEEIEKQRIESALLNQNNNRTKTAKELGIGRTLLIHKIKKYDLV